MTRLDRSDEQLVEAARRGEDIGSEAALLRYQEWRRFDNASLALATDTFNRLFYFERAAETYIRALQTGRPLNVLSDEIAEKTARELEEYPEQDARHLGELKAILDEEGSNYAN